MISVLMATFNGEAFVEEAIESVLGQRGVELELIVTDDGSIDGTASIVSTLARRDPRLRLAVRTHAGMAASRNACLTEARGSYLALLDQDDRCPAGKLARQLALLETYPGGGRRVRPHADVRHRAQPAPGYTMLLSAALLRREAVEAIGPFDREYASADDFDFLLRMIEQGHRIELESGLGVYHRRHHNQVSADLEATRRDCVRRSRGRYSAAAGMASPAPSSTRSWQERFDDGGLRCCDPGVQRRSHAFRRRRVGPGADRPAKGGGGDRRRIHRRHDRDRALLWPAHPADHAGQPRSGRSHRSRICGAERAVVGGTRLRRSLASRKGGAAAGGARVRSGARRGLLPRASSITGPDPAPTLRSRTCGVAAPC